MGKFDLHQVVTDQIVSALEGALNAGVKLPWDRPFTSSGYNVACNATTNKAYGGINILLSMIAMGKHNFPTARFLTFNQAKKAGGHILAGQKSCLTIVKYEPVLKKDAVTGDLVSSYGFLKHYSMFNVAQCGNLPESVVNGPAKPVKSEIQRNHEADSLIAATGMKVTEGSKACYIPSLHMVHMPKVESFISTEAYYATLFHEGVHYTGHKSILDRDLSGRFGTEAYAGEELIAELGAAFISAEFGFDHVTQSAAYIQSWIKLLKNDSKAIFTAAKHAQKAVDWFRSKALVEESQAIAA